MSRKRNAAAERYRKRVAEAWDKLAPDQTPRFSLLIPQWQNRIVGFCRAAQRHPSAEPAWNEVSPVSWESLGDWRFILDQMFKGFTNAN